MKLIISFALIFLSAFSSSFTTSENSTASLFNATVQHYLKQMKETYQWAPSVLFIETDDKTRFSKLREHYGPTRIVIKTPQEIKEYSIHHLGKTTKFLNIYIQEHTKNAYKVCVVAKQIRTMMKDGSPVHAYDSPNIDPMCTLSFDEQLRYKRIDCLIRTEKGGQD